MKYRALFIGGPLDGRERATEQPVSEVYIRREARLVPYRTKSDHHIECRYNLLFGYGDNTLVYSTFGAAETLDRLFEKYATVRET